MSFLGKVFGKKDEEPQKEQEKPEDLIFNPLKIHCGGFIDVDIFEGKTTYEVTEVCEVTRHLGGDIHKFTDYQLENNGKLMILRANPKGQLQNTNGSKDCDMLLLKSFFEGEFEEEIQKDAQCQVFTYHKDENTRIDYHSLRAGVNGYDASLKCISSKGTENRHIKFWDFYRKSDPNLGEMTSDDIFLFIEIDQGDGYINMWEGTVIRETEISIYNRS